MRCLPLLLVTAAATCAAASYLCCPGGGGLPRGRVCADGSPLNLDNCSTAYFLDATAEDVPLAVDNRAYLFYTNSNITIEEPPGKFCVSEEWGNGSIASAVVCFPEELEDARVPDSVYTAYGALLLVSAGFLAATLAVYLWLPALRDRDGLCLSAYAGSLALGSGALGLLQLTSRGIGDVACVFMAFFTYYWLLAAFFWLNIVAFNVWQCVTCQLYTKLSLIMGVTWLLEVISFATGIQGYIWLVADVLNCLQGVLIFLLVVAFRQRVRRLLLSRCPAAQRCFGIQPSPLSQAELPSGDEEECDEIDDANDLKAAQVRANGHSQ